MASDKKSNPILPCLTKSSAQKILISISTAGFERINKRPLVSSFQPVRNLVIYLHIVMMT